jgi:hypothetical protein
MNLGYGVNLSVVDSTRHPVGRKLLLRVPDLEKFSRLRIENGKARPSIEIEFL